MDAFWNKLIKEEMQKEYFQKLSTFLNEEKKKYKIFPKSKDVFNALEYCDFDKVKVLILGADPYHTPGAAHGLAFSVLPGVIVPPSLKNIFKELNNDLGIAPSKSGYLKGWAEQGVLLLNSVLTVRRGEAGSHSGKGWEIFTDRIISELNKKDNLVSILWGNYARSKKKALTNKTHLISESTHPSPLSAYNGFFGSKPFSQTNNFLISKNITPINWYLNENEDRVASQNMAEISPNSGT